MFIMRLSPGWRVENFKNVQFNIEGDLWAQFQNIQSKYPERHEELLKEWMKLNWDTGNLDASSDQNQALTLSSFVGGLQTPSKEVNPHHGRHTGRNQWCQWLGRKAGSRDGLHHTASLIPSSLGWGRTSTAMGSTGSRSSLGSLSLDAVSGVSTTAGVLSDCREIYG